MPQAAESPADDVRDIAPDRPYVVFEDGREGGRALVFEAPAELIVARTPAEAPEAFARMEAASRRGLHLAGYAS
jgi:hypothetical protein